MAVDIQGLAPLLQVFDMPTSVNFYRDVLGFDLVGHSPFYADGLFHWAMLKLGDAVIMLNTAYDEGERPAQPDPVRIAAHQDTGIYLGCADVDLAYQNLTASGLTLQPPQVVPYGMKQLHFLDPDGYAICLQWTA